MRKESFCTSARGSAGAVGRTLVYQCNLLSSCTPLIYVWVGSFSARFGTLSPFSCNHSFYLGFGLDCINEAVFNQVSVIIFNCKKWGFKVRVSMSVITVVCWFPPICDQDFKVSKIKY